MTRVGRNEHRELGRMCCVLQMQAIAPARGTVDAPVLDNVQIYWTRLCCFQTVGWTLFSGYREFFGGFLILGTAMSLSRAERKVH